MREGESGLDPAFAPLLGRGVLAIWNGIDEADEVEFNAWHTRQHLPERVSIPGFLRGRRYVNASGVGPTDGGRYFTLYEVLELETLASRPYLRRLDRPTPWTARMVARFRNSRRTAYRVATSRGTGAGGWLSTIEVRPLEDRVAPPHEVLAGRLLPELLDRRSGLVAVHLLEPDAAVTEAKAATAEGRTAAPEEPSPGWALLLEGLFAADVREAATAAVGGISRDLEQTADVNLYQLQVAVAASGAGR